MQPELTLGGARASALLVVNPHDVVMSFDLGNRIDLGNDLGD